MYEEFYQFNERPFTLAPDPSFLYLGKSHSRAMDILEYGIVSDAGITVISGEVGAGKTTVVRNLLDQLDENFTVGMITNTQKSFGDLIKWVLLSYDINTDESDHIKLYQKFVEFITKEHRAGRRVLGGGRHRHGGEAGRGGDRDGCRGCGRTEVASAYTRPAVPVR